MAKTRWARCHIQRDEGLPIKRVDRNRDGWWVISDNPAWLPVSLTEETDAGGSSVVGGDSLIWPLSRTVTRRHCPLKPAAVYRSSALKWHIKWYTHATYPPNLATN